MSLLSTIKARNNSEIKCVSNFDLDSNKIQNLGDPTISSDATNKNYVDTLLNEFNVLNYGAVGDGITDDTIPIQTALNAAGSSNKGGTVTLFSGKFLITNTLTIPTGVTFKGVNNGMKRGSFVFNAPISPTNYTIIGSAIIVGGTSFNAITMVGYNCTIQGIEFHYPNITRDTVTPAVHGHTISIGSNAHGCTIRDIQCNFCYSFCNVEGDGVTIDNIQGYPVRKGIFLGRVADVARITNVQFNFNVMAGATLSSPLIVYTLTNGTAYTIGGAEEFMFTNCFAYGYNQGSLYDGSSVSVTYGSWTNFGFDFCNYGIVILNNSINTTGVRYTNGNIIPLLTGILFQDTSAINTPDLYLNNLTIYNGSGYDRALWFQTNSKGKVIWDAGRVQDFTQQMVLIESATTNLKMIAVSNAGTGTRILNTGGGTIQDITPENNNIPGSTSIFSLVTNNTIDATNSTSGSLRSNGGFSAVKNIFAGQTLNTESTNTYSGNTATITSLGGAINTPGAINLFGTNNYSNTIFHNPVNSADPSSLTLRSIGVRHCYWPGNTNGDYARGIGPNTLWDQVPTGGSFKSFIGITNILTLNASVLNLNISTVSTSNTTGALTLSGSIGISNTTDAVSATNGGTFTTAGGAAIAKKLFVGTELSVGSNSTFNGTATLNYTPVNPNDAVHKGYIDTVINFFPVSNYGAVGDGITDDTTAIQAALNAAGSSNKGGIVSLSSGKYLISSTLSIPTGVTLRGVNKGLRRGSFVFTAPVSPTNYTIIGSAIIIATTGFDAITMNNHEACVEQIEFHYPNITTSTVTPSSSYGWTIKIGSNAHGCTVQDIQCNFCYKFCIVEGDGVTINNIQGYPVFRGIVLGRVADVARITNVQFNFNIMAGASLSSNVVLFTLTNGSSYVIQGAEEFMFINCFAYGYNQGSLYDGAVYPGVTYGSWTNFGFDFCNYGIVVSNTSINTTGVRYTNGNIIPILSGVLFQDSSTASESQPLLFLNNVTVFNGSGYDRAIWFQTNSRAKFQWSGGRSNNYTQQMILVESANVNIKLFGVHNVIATTRISNTGGATIEDIVPESVNIPETSSIFSIVTNNTTDAISSTNSPSLKSNGGLGVAKAAFIGGIINGASTTNSTSNTTGGLTLSGGIGISNTTDAVSITNGGTFTTAGGMSVAKKLFVGSLINTSTTSSTSNTTGASTLSGGIGISNTTDAVSATNGGTFTTAGGAAIAKKLFVGTTLNIGQKIEVTRGTGTVAANAVTINAMSGVITFTGTVGGTSNSSTISVTNSTITSNSIVTLTLNHSGNGQISIKTVNNINNGSFDFVIQNHSATTTSGNILILFLVIN